MVRGNYDLVAPFYDKLSKIIFGNAIKDAQIFLIDVIKPDSNILIIGGGTGWIIEAIAKKQINNLRITYVEISKNMISIAKNRDRGNIKIDFINQSIFDIEFKDQYDVVITPFILDNFSDENIEKLFGKLNICLKQNGLWLHTDFRASNLNTWQKIFSKMMYLFFRIMCNIEATNSTETGSKFKSRGFKIISSKKFYSNFICAVVYRKS